MIKMAGTRVSKNGLILTLPDSTQPGAHQGSGMSLMVATSCTAPELNVIMLVASVLIGSVYLRSPWKRLLLTVFVIPLVIARNGLNIFTIAEMCAHENRNVIGSPIHQHGGLIFFLLSLVPFVLFLRWLRKLESRV